MTRREKLHDQTREEIKRIARAQMAAEGTAAISLRGIAREMELTAPALYRYFPTRDDLITALIVDAFNGLADAMQAGDSEAPHEAYGARLFHVLLNYRDWALRHATDFQLIYGNPIPGYHAPGEVTVPAAARGFFVVLGPLGDAERAGVLRLPPTIPSIPPTIQAFLQAETVERGYSASAQALYLAAVGWSRIHGILMLELFEHLPPVVGDVDAFYRAEITALIESFGLTITA